MATLGVWSVGASPNGEAGSDPARQPRSVERSYIELEKHLEDWIADDPNIIGGGLTIVGRQLHFDEGRLDLLAIDSRERWVVIEVKPGTLDTGALTQALSYAASIVRVPADDLEEKIRSRVNELGDGESRMDAVRSQLNIERDSGGRRDISILLVGAGVTPALKRANEFLGGFGVPTNVVSFDVFELDGGQKLLIREVIDELVEARPKPPKLTVSAIRQLAEEVGVAAQFNRFVKMSKDAGLAVQPQRASVRIAPMENRTRFLMYARPQAGTNGGEIAIDVGPKAFAEFFPHVTEDAATEALARSGISDIFSGGELDARLDKIERFLTEKLRPHDGE